MSRKERRAAKEKKPNLFKRFGAWFKNLKTWKKTVLIIILIILIAAGCVFGYIYSKLSKIDTDALDSRDLSCVDVDGYINVLLLGVDARDMKSLKDCRTDAIMIASIKEETGEVHLTSIYRDTYLKMGGDDLYDKVTHAFSYGGAKESIKTVNQALDLNIKHYVVFNFKAVADVVDGVGGINLNIKDYEIEQLNKYTIETAENIGKAKYNLVEEAGKQKIEGVQAVSYGRIRYGVGDDFKRTERMRVVLEKSLGRVKKMKFTQIDKLIDKVLPQVNTNLKTMDILTLAWKVKDFNIVGSASFPYEVSTGYLNGTAYVFPSDLVTDVKKFHKDVFGKKNFKPSNKVYEIAENIDIALGSSTGQGTIDLDEIEKNPTEAPEITPDVQEPQEPEYPDGGETGGGSTGGGTTGGEVTPTPTPTPDPSVPGGGGSESGGTEAPSGE